MHIAHAAARPFVCARPQAGDLLASFEVSEDGKVSTKQIRLQPPPRHRRRAKTNVFYVGPSEWCAIRVGIGTIDEEDEFRISWDGDSTELLCAPRWRRDGALACGWRAASERRASSWQEGEE